jgi:S1-C subfamily serine protease
MNRFFALLLLTALASIVPAAAEPHAGKKSSGDSGDFKWENAVIEIEVTSKAYNYIQPWERSEKKIYKSGVVIEGHQIVTTAEGLDDATEIRFKKQGEGLFSLGKVVWIDYQANLAALTTDDALNTEFNPGQPDFWKGLQAAKLADPVPMTGEVEVLRWRDDSLEERKGDVDRMTVEPSALSFVSVPALKINSGMTGVGYGEPVVAGNKLVGLAYAQGNDAITAVPSSFMAPIIKAEQAKTYTGLGYFDFTWDTPDNPLNLEYLKLPGPARGVIVKETGMKPGTTSMVHPRDILLSIDGFDLNPEGNYTDPQYNKLSLENLSSRGKFAGQTCKFKIWRDGKEMDVTYTLPKAAFTDELLPQETYDQAPEYVLTGGLVFVPLTESFLRSWGPSWRQHAPFRLSFYENDKVKPDRSQRVVLSQVLPNPANIGYESLRNMVIDEVNGVKITQIGDVLTALKTPVNGFDVFRFDPGQSVQEIVLDATDIDHVNEEVMARYHIPADHVINADAAPVVKQ